MFFYRDYFRDGFAIVFTYRDDYFVVYIKRVVVGQIVIYGGTLRKDHAAESIDRSVGVCEGIYVIFSPLFFEELPLLDSGLLTLQESALEFGADRGDEFFLGIVFVGIDIYLLCVRRPAFPPRIFSVVQGLVVFGFGLVVVGADPKLAIVVVFIPPSVFSLIQRG